MKRVLFLFLLVSLYMPAYGQTTISAYQDTIRKNYGIKQTDPPSLLKSVAYGWLILADIVALRPTYDEVDSMIGEGGGGGVPDSTLVPYTGATTDVNLGVYGITDNGRNPSINANDRMLYNSDGAPVLDWSTPAITVIGDVDNLLNGTKMTIDDGVGITFSGNVFTAASLYFTQANSTLVLKSGSNATSGIGTLVNGTVTISTTSVEATDIIIVCYNTRSGVLESGLGAPSASIIPNTSFVVNSLGSADGSLNLLDNSTFYWWIIHVQ